MTSDKMNKMWLLATGLLILIIIVSSVIIWINRNDRNPLQVLPPQASSFTGEIHIMGAVNRPGIYPVGPDDTIDGLIRASGGFREHAHTACIDLYIPLREEVIEEQPQKININRAETWLLQALPDVGSVRAEAIVQYREQNGPFKNIEEIRRVTGIGAGTYEKIKNLISISD